MPIYFGLKKKKVNKAEEGTLFYGCRPSTATGDLFTIQPVKATLSMKEKKRKSTNHVPIRLFPDVMPLNFFSFREQIEKNGPIQKAGDQ